MALLFFNSSCDVFQSKDDDRFVKVVPDNTIFIASALEATEDTVHHYPEVYVGSVTHVEDYYLNRLCCESIEGIWWPVLNAQVNKTARTADLVRTDINDAKVSITGPLGSTREQIVTFAGEGLGVYGDQQYELELVPNSRYRLDVTLADGRSYRAFTTLPGLAIWQVPDTVETELELVREGDGYREQTPGIERKLFEYQPPDNGWLTTIQINYSDGIVRNNLTDVTDFLYGDRGHFLRSGATYTIRTNSSFPERRSHGPLWLRSSSSPLQETITSWMTLNQLNEDLSRQWYYQSIFVFIGASSEGFWSKKDDEFVSALFANDTTILFDNSNILKVGPDGKVLPKAQTDAIGVFGGFSSVYRTTVMKPKRSWDPDTLDWGPK